MIEQEQWRMVAGHYAYEVSDHGRVRSLNRIATDCWGRVCHYRGRILRLTFDHKGYPLAKLSIHSRQFTYKVHHLVAAAFIGERPLGHQVNHKNGIKTDNYPINLEYVTPHENQVHAVQNGLMAHLRGIQNGNAKLNESSVAEIRKRYKPGVIRMKDLGFEYGVTGEMVGNIVNRKNWKHI